MTSDRSEWLDRGRIPSLDGLRAIAVLLVLLAHAHQTPGFPAIELLHSVGRVGHVGVEVFFVLSGFLITTLILREIDRTGQLRLKSFYWRRMLRILPAYVTLLLVVAAAQQMGKADVPPEDWLAAATFTMNFRGHPAWELGHGWSLSIEEHFYLLWPLATAVLARRGQLVVLTGCIVGCFAARWIVLLAFPAWTPMAELWTFTRLDTIASGCLLAVLARRPWWHAKFDALSRWWPAVLATFAASLALSTLSAKWSVGIGYSLHSACIAVLIWSAARSAPGWLNWRPLAAVGVGSYSLYLWQQLFLNPHSTSWITSFPQNLTFAAAAALASYWLVESPFLRIKDRQSARPGNAIPIADAPAVPAIDALAVENSPTS